MKAVVASASFGRASLTARRFHSIYANLPLAPPDKILGLTEAFKKDPFAKKVSLGVGAYRDEEGNPYVLSSIREAEQKVVSAGLDKEYSPITGNPNFVKSAAAFAYGADSRVIKEDRLAATQCLSGTGGLRLLGQLVNKFLASTQSSDHLDNGKLKIYVPNPTWGPHLMIFEDSGLAPQYYTYYDKINRSLNFPAMLGDIEKAANGSLFVLHACAHNPTGCDPTTQQWDELSVLMKKKQHIAFFDSAYQGFASGDAEADAYAVRKFVEDGHQIILCQSFAKNFGLYGERVGLLSMVTQSAEETERVNSQMKRIVRAMYSNPPIHGARIVDTVLSDPVLRAQWREECKHMADRIKQMRVLLREKLEAGTGSPWQHITDQIGMFCFTGLDQTQVLRLREEFHIYCTEDGRFSMAGINVKNIDYLASSVVAVTAS